MPEPRRDSIITSYPGKFVYTLLTIFVNAARLPLWMIYFIPSATRPNSNWSWRQALRVRIVRAFLYWSSQVEIITPYDLNPGAEKDQWITLSPVDSKFYAGVASGDPKISPGQTGATWYPSKPTKAPGKVVLHFHGGAFVIGDGRKKDAGFLADTLIKHAKVPFVCCPNYRLASNAGGRFPAALQDAITSYVYLVNTLKVNSRDIIVSGDSAGANLVFSLVKYLGEHGSSIGLGLPSAALLWSPWVDPVGGTDLTRFYQSPNEPTDYVNLAFGAWGARCYMPLKETKTTNSYIDMLHNPFKTEVPLYFCIGDNEILMHDDLATAEAFEKLGNNVTVSVEPKCPHDVILVGDKTSFNKEAESAAQKAGAWLKKLDWEKVRE